MDLLRYTLARVGVFAPGGVSAYLMPWREDTQAYGPAAVTPYLPPQSTVVIAGRHKHADHNSLHCFRLKIIHILIF